MLVYIFHLHDFSIIYLQGYHLTFVDIMSPICDSVVFYFYIYIYNTQTSQSFRALTSSYFTFFHDMLSFNQIFLVYGYGCNFFSLFVLCQTILKNKFKSIYRILSWLASLYRRWFHSCSKVLIYKEVILFPMKCIKLFFIYVYTKYISCYCNVLLLIFIIII